MFMMAISRAPPLGSALYACYTNGAMCAAMLRLCCCADARSWLAAEQTDRDVCRTQLVSAEQGETVAERKGCGELGEGRWAAAATGRGQRVVN